MLSVKMGGRTVRHEEGEAKVYAKSGTEDVHNQETLDRTGQHRTDTGPTDLGCAGGHALGRLIFCGLTERRFVP